MSATYSIDARQTCRRPHSHTAPYTTLWDSTLSRSGARTDGIDLVHELAQFLVEHLPARFGRTVVLYQTQTLQVFDS